LVLTASCSVALGNLSPSFLFGMDNWRKSPPTGLSMLMDFECPFNIFIHGL
jgi:hypothetical protein